MPSSTAVDKFVDALLDPLQNFDPVSLEDVCDHPSIKHHTRPGCLPKILEVRHRYPACADILLTHLCEQFGPIVAGYVCGRDGKKVSVEYPPRVCGALLKHAEGRCLAHQMVASSQWPLRHVNSAHLEQMDPLVIQRAMGTTDGDITYIARVMPNEWITCHWPYARLGARWFLTMLNDEQCFLCADILLTRGLLCSEIRDALNTLYATPSLSAQCHIRLCSLPSAHNPRPAHIVALAHACQGDVSCDPAQRRVAALAVDAHKEAARTLDTTRIDSLHQCVPNAAPNVTSSAWFENVYAPQDDNGLSVSNGTLALYNSADVYDSLLDGETITVADTLHRHQASVGTWRKMKDDSPRSTYTDPYGNDDARDTPLDGARSDAEVHPLPEDNMILGMEKRKDATFEELLRATKAWRIDCH